MVALAFQGVFALLFGAGLMSLWQTTHSELTSRPHIHQLYVDRICHAYKLICEEIPGLTVPPALHDYIGLETDSDEPILIWQTMASYVNKQPHGNHDKQDEALVRASTCLLNKATRSVYYASFWPEIEKEPENLRMRKLKAKCSWEA